MRVLLAALLLAAPLMAQEVLEEGAPESALQRYQIGRELYRAGKIPEAEAEFRSAFDLFPESAKLAFNLGRVNERLGRQADAVRFYEAYLALRPDADDKAEVEKVVASLKARLDAARPELVITSVPSGAAVFVGASTESAGVTPLTLRVDPGSHAVRIELAGYEPALGTVQVEEGKSAALALTLKKPGGGVAPPPARAAGGIGGLQIAGIVVFAAGLGGAGVGAYYTALAADTANKDIGPGRQDDYDQAQTDLDEQNRLMWVGYGAGAGLMAVGAVLYILGSPADDAGAASWAPAPGGVSVRW